MDPNTLLKLAGAIVPVGQLGGSLFQQRGNLQLARTQGAFGLASQGVGLASEGIGLAKTCVELHHQTRAYEAQTRAAIHKEEQRTARYLARCHRDLHLFADANHEERMFILQQLYGAQDHDL